MPRKAREISENGIYYIYTRSLDNLQLCNGSDDYQKLIDIIKETKVAMPFALYAFAVTKCELHLLVKEFTPGGISKLMKKICFEFTKYRNNAGGETGKLFKDRFKSQPVPLDDHFLPLVKFIHQVPIKCGEVMNISAFPFCSYQVYFNDRDGGFVDCGAILNYFQGGDPLQKFKIYHAGFPSEDLKPKERLVATRDEVAEIIEKIAKMPALEIRKQDRSKRDTIIKKVKKSSGLSIRQIAFATRLSRNTVSEALKARRMSL